MSACDLCLTISGHSAYDPLRTLAACLSWHHGHHFTLRCSHAAGASGGPTGVGAPCPSPLVRLRLACDDRSWPFGPCGSYHLVVADRGKNDLGSSICCPLSGSGAVHCATLGLLNGRLPLTANDRFPPKADIQQHFGTTSNTGSLCVRTSRHPPPVMNRKCLSGPRTSFQSLH